MNSFALDQIEQELEAAKERLEAYQRSRTSADHLARLKASSPLHPVLILRAAAGFVTFGSGAAAIVMLVLPYTTRDLAQFVNGMDTAVGFPVFVAGLVVCFCGLVMATAAHFMAISLGKDSPLMASEARVHQRLVSEVQQLEARKRTSTPAPARSRIASA